MGQETNTELTPKLIFRTFSRGWRKICPSCGKAPMFKSYFQMHHKCPNCGVVFERENGEYVASMYMSIFIDGLLFVALYVTLAFWMNASLSTQLLVLMPVIGLFPVWFYPKSKSLWAAALYMMGYLYED